MEVYSIYHPPVRAPCYFVLAIQHCTPSVFGHGAQSLLFDLVYDNLKAGVTDKPLTHFTPEPFPRDAIT